MAKLILNDKTEIADVINVSVGGFSKKCTATEMAEIYEALSDDKLSKIVLVNNDGDTVAAYTEKHASAFSYANGVGTVSFSDIDMNAKKIADLSAQIEDANNAIAEMSEMMAAMM